MTEQRTPGRADYQERQDSRQERLEARADKAAASAQGRFETARQSIPSCGTPILIGHHSERAHRNAFKRHDNNMRKGIEEQKKAERLQSRADGVGKAGISNDDPEVIQKLEAKLKETTEARDKAKAFNKLVRSKKFKKIEEQAAQVQAVHDVLGYNLGLCAKLLEPNCFGDVKLDVTGHTAEIRRINERITAVKEELEAQPFDLTGEITGEGGEPVTWRAYTDEDENRVCFEFDGRLGKGTKGNPEKFTWLWFRSQGYTWSRSNDRFQRQLNKGGRNMTLYIVKDLKKGGTQ
tara:strand:- start:925 stop:1800 length:876 start_codon:yes stop_codon:yes gene_type:complete